MRIGQRRHDRQFGLGQFLQESVLLQDGLVAPARRAVELGDHRRALVQPHLIHPVLETVQRQQAPVWRQADGFERIEHGVRRQIGERTGRRGVFR